MLGRPVRTHTQLASAFVAACCWLCPAGAQTPDAAASGGTDHAAPIRFREVSETWGLDFRHHHGGSGRRYMVETMIGGLVAFDYDGDGDHDLFFVDGAALPGYDGETPISKLFRNDGAAGFVDVTASAGLSTDAYGSGAVTADVDGDRDLDLYLTVFGTNLFFENLGDGTFRERGRELGLDEASFAAAGAFADADLDGDLDLYLANYVRFTIDAHRPCTNDIGVEGYCRGTNYPSARDVFFRNHEGRFQDETAAAGFTTAYAPGLGVLFADFDFDGAPDVYVANDGAPNFLFRNMGDGTFLDDSLLSGTAFSGTGAPEGGMGVALGDVDENGLFDILVTNFELETNALYTTEGEALYSDRRFRHGIAEPSLPYVGFGVDFGDLDNDGDLDLLVANGHVLDNPQELQGLGAFEQPNQVYANLGSGRFRAVPEAGLDVTRASRGLVTADLDGDGDLDFAVNNSNDRAEVYENLTEGGSWLAVDLDSLQGRHLGVGSRLVAKRSGTSFLRVALAGNSYLSQSADTVHFGLPPEPAASPAAGPPSVDLEISWPTAPRQLFRELPADRRVRVFASVPTRPAG